MSYNKTNDFFPTIIIKGNRHSSITDNKIIITPPETRLEIFHTNSLNRKDLSDLFEETHTVDSAFEREAKFVEKLEIILSINKKRNEVLTIRIWGIYSGFSSIRSSYDKSDIAALELDEKKLLIELAKKRFPIKMILTMDIDNALEFGYSLEDVRQRAYDLCAVCRDLKKYDNMQLVIDSNSVKKSMFMLDDVLMIKLLNFDKETVNYSRSIWTSDSRDIRAEIYDFETRFCELEKNYYITKKIIPFDSYDEYIRTIIDKRIEKHTMQEK